MSVYLCKRRGTPKLDRRKLIRRATKLLTHLGLSDHELSILLTNDQEMTALNHTYRGRQRTTDVLSFSQLEGGNPANPRILGDVVISLPTAQIQATKRGVDLMDELVTLLVHGVLHLGGYDHEGVERARANEMRAEQRRLVALLGAKK